MIRHLFVLCLLYSSIQSRNTGRVLLLYNRSIEDGIRCSVNMLSLISSSLSPPQKEAIESFYTWKCSKAERCFFELLDGQDGSLVSMGCTDGDSFDTKKMVLVSFGSMDVTLYRQVVCSFLNNCLSHFLDRWIPFDALFHLQPIEPFDTLDPPRIVY